MRNNKGTNVFATIFAVSLLIASALIGPGKFTFVSLLVVLTFSVIYNLCCLAAD